MPIEFINLLDADGWMPMPVDQASPTYLWDGGGLLADAPVDMGATFKDAMFVQRGIDPKFNLNGLRCRPNFTVPRHHHNMDELIVVFGGSFTVEWGEDGKGGKETFGPGEFWISDAGTAYMMTAGPEGVTYTEQWPEPSSELRTWWHEAGWVSR
jgi:hypothetical protein